VITNSRIPVLIGGANATCSSRAKVSSRFAATSPRPASSDATSWSSRVSMKTAATSRFVSSLSLFASATPASTARP